MVLFLLTTHLETINGFNTTFTSDLKVGDFVTVPGAGAGGADLVTRVTNVTNNTTLTIATAATSVTSVPIVRKRNQLRDQERNVLLRKLRKNTIKTLKTDDNNGASQTSMTFRQQFVTTTTSSGEINLTAGSNESFASNSNTDYIVTILTAGSVISGSVT